MAHYSFGKQRDASRTTFRNTHGNMVYFLIVHCHVRDFSLNIHMPYMMSYEMYKSFREDHTAAGINFFAAR